MTLIASLAERCRSLFHRGPKDTEWLLPGNEVTRAIESGRDLANYEAQPGFESSLERPRATLDVEALRMDPLPPLPEPPRRHVISDDAVHGAPAGTPLAPSEQPLEAAKPRKRWWRRAA